MLMLRLGMMMMRMRLTKLKVLIKRKEKGLVGQLVLPITVIRTNVIAWIVILRLLEKLCMLDYRKLRLKVTSPPSKVVNNTLSLNTLRLWKAWEILMVIHSTSL